jgi:hypothetical protein
LICEVYHKGGKMSNRGRGAFGRGRAAADELWDWRWALVLLLVVAALGRLAEALGLI